MGGSETLPAELAAFARLLAGTNDGRSGGSELLAVVAHPDDETIGFGGQLHRLAGVTIVHVTDGAPRSGFDARGHGFDTPDAYAEARRRELEAAVGEAGLSATSLLSLGVADQDAPRRLLFIARELRRLFEARRPRFVLTHPLEGGHPDHDATAFAVWAARRLLGEEGEAPTVIEMASYHLGEDGAVFGRFVPGEAELVLPLAENDALRKRSMIAAHATQARVLAQFGTAEERFRLAPSYDFTALPNGGRLLYETMNWGLSGAEWLALARAALDELGLRAGRGAAA